MKYIFIIIMGLMLLSGTVLATEFDLPEGRPVTLDRIENFLEDISRFLIRMSILMAMATLVISGFMWLKAGSNPQKVTAAKEWFKTGLIGTIVILAAGTIIRTIDYFIQNAGF